MACLFGFIRLGQQPGIECLKISLRHEHFAADFEDRGNIARQPMRNIRYGPHIGSYIFPHLPVASRGRLHQFAIFIAQRAGQAVNLILCRQRDRRIGWQIQKAPDTRDEILDIFIRKRVVEAHHPLGVGDLTQRRRFYGCTDLRVGAVRPHQLRKSSLQFVIPPDKRIELSIRNLGCVMRMIELVMMRDRLGEAHQLIRGFRIREGSEVAHRLPVTVSSTAVAIAAKPGVPGAITSK